MKTQKILMLYLGGDRAYIRWVWVFLWRMAVLIPILAAVLGVFEYGFSLHELLADLRQRLPLALLGVLAPIVLIGMVSIPLVFAIWRHVNTMNYCKKKRISWREFFDKTEEEILEIWDI